MIELDVLELDLVRLDGARALRRRSLHHGILRRDRCLARSRRFLDAEAQLDLTQAEHGAVGEIEAGETLTSGEDAIARAEIDERPAPLLAHELRVPPADRARA